MPGRENFTIEIPNPTLTAIPNGAASGVKSPNDLKTPQRTPGLGRESILGAAQKARNQSQVSISESLQLSNGVGKAPSDEGSNPLKRRNTDVGIDYPRRRATIAVRVE